MGVGVIGLFSGLVLQLRFEMLEKIRWMIIELEVFEINYHHKPSRGNKEFYTVPLKV